MPSAKRHTAETGHHFYVIYLQGRSPSTRYAPGYLCCHTVGGVYVQVHASDPAIRKEAMPLYETHVGGTQARALSATNMRE